MQFWVLGFTILGSLLGGLQLEYYTTNEAGSVPRRDLPRQQDIEDP